MNLASFPSSMALAIVWYSSKSCVVVEAPFCCAAWRFDKMLFSCRKVNICLKMHLSNTLLMTDSRLIGLKLPFSDFEHFLCRGVISANFHMVGNWAWMSEFLKIEVRLGAIDLYVSLRSIGLTLSGHEAFRGCRSFSTSRTISSVMSNNSSVLMSFGSSGKFGFSGVLILVALEKNSLNQVAFSLSFAEGMLFLISGGLWCLVLDVFA